MNINVKQTIWLGAAFLIVALIIFVFGFGGITINPYVAMTTISALVIGFVAIAGGFLGLDLAHLIGTTSFLPAGQYKEVDAWKYIITACMLFALFGVILYVQLMKPVFELGTPLMTTGFGGLILLGALILGVQANKLATGIAPEPIPTTTSAKTTSAP